MGNERNEKERTDKFGRLVKSRPKENKKRSLSPRSRDRSSLGRWHSRSPVRRSRSPISSITISNRTDIDDPHLLKARVFIGKVPVAVAKDEIETIFSKYGKILGCSVHEKGFAFVQFDKEEHAKESVKMEDGTLLKGANIGVRMAADGRKQTPRGRGRSSPGPYDREPGYPDREAARPGPPRERSPLRDPYDRYRSAYATERDPLMRRDDPYVDPYRRPLPLDDKDPFRRPLAIDDKDPFRRPLPLDDPFFDRYGRDDPFRYRRDPFADPYRDPYYRDYVPPAPEAVAPVKRTPTADCQIIILNSALRRYAESIDHRLKNLNLIVEIVLISDDRTVTQMIEEASRKSILFVLVCNSQNEVHQSVTLNILHTTAQEHRNMPIADAMSLVARSFETYLQSLKEKSAAVVPVAPSPAAPSIEGAPFVPPCADECYLLNLLADNRQLTAEELDKVITYLTGRREKQFGRPSSEPARAPVLATREPQLFTAGSDQRPGNNNALQQQELQAKILGFLNGSGNTATGTGQPRLGSDMSGVNRANLPTQQQNSSNMSALINFDNPSVQKALDNLIQSGPNLLKNISSQGGLTAPNKASPLNASDARRSNMGYGISSQLGPSVAGRQGGLGLMPRAQGPQTGMRRQF